MGRDAAKSIGNPWRDARLRAAQWNEKLNSREGVEEELGISVDSVRRIETGINKVMPVEHAVLLADLYNAPELLNHYCLNECPIGCRRPLSDELVDIDRVTVKLLKGLKVDKLEELKDKLLDIAEDGKVTKEEVPSLKEIVDYLTGVSKTISEVVYQKDQWMGFADDNPIVQRLRDIAVEQLRIYYSGSALPMSPEYVFMSWSSSEITLRSTFDGKGGCHYWYESDWR